MTKAKAKKRMLLDDRQVRIFMRDMQEFGYPVTFDEIRQIANEVAAGTSKPDDTVARMLCRELDEIEEMKATGRRP